MRVRSLAQSMFDRQSCMANDGMRFRKGSAPKFLLIPAHSQRVRYAIDIVEPGGDQSNLQNSLVNKTSRPQALVILLRNSRGIASQLRYVAKHDSILR